MISCDKLAAKIVEIQPDMPPTEVARLCLLILIGIDENADLDNSTALKRCWQSASFRLEAAADQYAAMTSDLDQLCSEGPVSFNPDQIWTLLRAVKIQSQILELYTGEASLI